MLISSRNELMKLYEQHGIDTLKLSVNANEEFIETRIRQGISPKDALKELYERHGVDTSEMYMLANIIPLRADELMKIYYEQRGMNTSELPVHPVLYFRRNSCKSTIYFHRDLPVDQWSLRVTYR